MTTSYLSQLLTEIKASQSVEDKLKISRTYAPAGDVVKVNSSHIKPNAPQGPVPVKIGDDTAAIPDGYGNYTLFATEGIVETFVNKDPWFAGYSAVMVNISDICAMGGLPIAVTDVIWAQDEEASQAIWQGMMAAAEAYSVPVVGGHTCYNSSQLGLSVSIIGKAQQLITSYDAMPGDQLVMVVDMDGAYYEDYPFWNASTKATPEKLQTNMKLLSQIAQMGLTKAGKDISMGGLLGTMKMLLRTSKVGATIDLDKIPCPDEDLKRWLMAFPSYGYVLAVKENNVQELKDIMDTHHLTCQVIGEFISEEALYVLQGDEKEKF